MEEKEVKWLTKMQFLTIVCVPVAGSGQVSHNPTLHVWQPADAGAVSKPTPSSGGCLPSYGNPN